MCGFAGVVTWDDRYRVSQETLAKMSATIAHRGPDGEGHYINHENEVTPDHPQIALAFRRLAILDPDPRSNQPFTDGRHWLVFNGEIYNFRELKEELTQLRPDYQWRTTGDTEVLLCAFAVWGEKCVDHLNGMFAFVVWNEQEKTLFMARDRMGQKPLFFAAIDRDGTPWHGVPADSINSVAFEQVEAEVNKDVGQRFEGTRPLAIAFASELSALLPLHWFDRKTHTPVISEYLRYGYISVIETIYAGAQRMPAATGFRLQNGRFRITRFFDANIANDSDPPNGSCRQLVIQAIQRQLVSDVPLGCFLSGGVDSSIIAAAMKASGSDTSTFTVGFADSRYDERGYADAVAKHLGTRHHSFLVEPNAIEDLPKLAQVFGEPFADSSALPTHYLSRETRRHVKVALSGDGADELFGGYERDRCFPWPENCPRFFVSQLALESWHRFVLQQLGSKRNLAKIG